MARIAGVDIPRNKQIWVALQYIHGIGSTLSHRIIAQAGVNSEVKTDELTEGEVNRIREIIDREYRVEGEGIAGRGASQVMADLGEFHLRLLSLLSENPGLPGLDDMVGVALDEPQVVK